MKLQAVLLLLAAAAVAAAPLRGRRPARALTSAGSASARAARLLSQQALLQHSSELASLAQEAASPDDIDKVKDMIRHMITNHQAGLADMTDQKTFCDKETRTTENKLTRLTDTRDKAQADVDRATAELQALKEEIATAHEDLVKARKAIADATEERNQGKAHFAEAKAKYERQPRTAEGADAFREAAAGDARFEIEFERAHDSNMTGIEQVEKDAKLKQSEVVTRNRDILELERDVKSAKEQLAAAVTYKEQLQHQCVARAEPHEERQRRRDAQIDSLKDAYQILNGESIP